MKKSICSIIAIILLPYSFCPSFCQNTLYKSIKIVQGLIKVGQSLTLTDDELIDYASKTIEQEDASNKICSSKSKYSIRLTSLTQGIEDLEGLPLNFKVYYDNKIANAFASPDGSIRVYSRLMDLLTDEELIGIIGHEIGHLACHHSLKAYKSALLISAARDGLMATDSFGDLAESALGSLAESLLNAKFSRMEETEADDYGYDYLADHGYDPLAIASALEKLDALQTSKSNEATRYISHLFSTHPELQERVKRLKER